MEVTARTWCRADFGGGTLDIWPLGLLHPGAVTVNLAIDAAARVSLRPNRESSGEYRLVASEGIRSTPELGSWLDDPATSLVGHLASSLALDPVEIELSSDSPRGGGLGASSALAVAFIAAAEAFTGSAGRSDLERCRLARDIEARMMRLPTGLQDHLPALSGGLLAIHHQVGDARVERLEIDFERLGECLIIAFSGQSHFSAGNNWRIVRARLDGDPEVTGRFDEIAQAARELREAFLVEDLPRVGRLMSREWSHRRQLAEGISTERIERMLRVAGEHGAWGGKACGAGGGGCVAFLAPPEKRAGVVAALSEISQVLPVSPCPRPFELVST